jgi:hypothetical protein
VNREGRSKATLAAIVVALLCVAGGLLRGVLPGDGALAARAAADPEPPRNTRPRDPAAALAVLSAHAHWGRYTPGAAAAPDATRAAPPRQPLATDDPARFYRLVGIEHRNGTPVALLLPMDAVDGSVEAIRKGLGDSVAEGVSISAIDHDSVRFTTPGGTSTLHLYGNEQ